MWAAAAYLLVFAGLLYYNRFFGLFSDPWLRRSDLVALLFVKAFAIPVFYLVYENHYGGIRHMDTGKFYHDARVLHNCAVSHTSNFLKVFAGADDKVMDHPCLDSTENWKEGRTRKVFYNDNRLLIRVHALLHFVAFDSWFTHAFFSCFLSFTGLFFLHKTFAVFLAGRQRLLFLLLCLLPSLWFFTGALMKEGLVALIMGLSTFHLRLLTERFSLKQLFLCLFFLGISLLLKPFFLLPVFYCFLTFFILRRRMTAGAPVIYLILLLAALSLVNYAGMAFSGKSLSHLIAAQQRAFRGAAAGGIFLSGDTTFVRLEYDTSLVRKVPGTLLYTIRDRAAYTYWEDSHNNDTLYCTSNTDTVSMYELAFMTPASRSNLSLPDMRERPGAAMVRAGYHALFYPFFINAGGALQIFASAENLFLALALLFIILTLIRKRGRRFLPSACLIFVVLYCILVGLTSPNSGAIMRYRSPALVFLVIALTYCLSLIERPAHPAEGDKRSN